MNFMVIKPISRPDAKEVRAIQNLTVFTQVKKQKGQKYLEPQDQWLSTSVYRVRHNPLKHYSGGLKRKQVLNVPEKYVHTMA
jgi:hypothetical protein